MKVRNSGGEIKWNNEERNKIQKQKRRSRDKNRLNRMQGDQLRQTEERQQDNKKNQSQRDRKRHRGAWAEKNVREKK